MGKINADNLFTPAELERIRSAVVAAEADTAGEIATMVVDRSDDYPEAVTLAAVLGAALIALLLAVASHHVTVWSHLPLTLLLYFPCRQAAGRIPMLQRPFVGPKRRAMAVRDRAVRAFYEKGLYRTSQATGILIFISLFERKVWILGDRGINSRIPAASWQELARTLAEGLRTGRAADALCSVIRQCGEELARHFPANPAVGNELPDELLRDNQPAT